MKKPYQFLLALGIAAASLSSCSRANYAFNATAPTAEPVQAGAMASDAAASGTAMVTAPMPAAELTTPAQEAAAALAHHPAATRSQAQATTPAKAATKVALTRAERKTLRQELKRQVAAAPKATTADGKSQLTAVLLAFFLGALGIHRFYLGYTGLGILELLTLGVFGILSLIDFIRILIGDLKPKNGEYTKKL